MTKCLKSSVNHNWMPLPVRYHLAIFGGQWKLLIVCNQPADFTGHRYCRSKVFRLPRDLARPRD